MERRPDIGFDSYDRFFPNQDTLPAGGFGNLIALPLQRRLRECGNSVFVDENGVAYSDQWDFLASIGKIGRSTVEEMVRAAEVKGRVLGVRAVLPDDADTAPWTLLPSRRHAESPLAGPMPAALELTLGNAIYIGKETLPPGLRNRLIRVAAFQNPEFYKAQAMRLPTYDKPRIIACAEDHPKHVALPRGCLDDVKGLLSDLKVPILIKDERRQGQSLNVSFHGELRPDQNTAAKEMLAHDIGVLSATTAFGKTVVASWLIAKRGVNTLVLVHRRQLQEQWVDRLSTFLGIPTKSIGMIGGGRKRITGMIDVAVIQSMSRKGVVDDVVGQYGHVIVDECHHLSAQSFEQVVHQAKAKYVTGLSATVTRKDGHHPIIFMQCGPVRHRVNAREQAAARPFEHVVCVRPAAFKLVKAADPNVIAQFRDLYNELIADEGRNQLICGDILQSLRDGRSPIVLTERNEHLDTLAKLLSNEVKHLITLRGGMGRKALRAATDELAAIPQTEERVLLATGRFIGEGFDDARLDTLFLTLPVSWHGTIAQYVGRLHRLHDKKKEVRVYDYADLNVPMLARMFDRRCRGYEAVGYAIQLPASARSWMAHRNFSSRGPNVEKSIRGQRAAIGARRRRFASRKFICPHASPSLRMLKAPHALRAAVKRFSIVDWRACRKPRDDFASMPNCRCLLMAGARWRWICFALNRDLPWKLTADGTCLTPMPTGVIDARMRQENGYIVLRFLAEDVGKRLDEVLDAILRARCPAAAIIRSRYSPALRTCLRSQLRHLPTVSTVNETLHFAQHSEDLLELRDRSKNHLLH